MSPSAAPIQKASFVLGSVGSAGVRLSSRTTLHRRNAKLWVTATLTQSSAVPGGAQYPWATPRTCIEPHVGFSQIWQHTRGGQQPRPGMLPACASRPQQQAGVRCKGVQCCLSIRNGRSEIACLHLKERSGRQLENVRLSLHIKKSV